ncbi:hypothetical protein NL676_029212 [Syzygium grande]|nr:hypothetical protein NL676_029212 [Syzygium grande]
MPSSPGPISPAALDASNTPRWNPLAISLVVFVCTVFLLFSYYSILKRFLCAFRLTTFSRNRAPEQRQPGRPIPPVPQPLLGLLHHAQPANHSVLQEGSGDDEAEHWHPSSTFNFWKRRVVGFDRRREERDSF